LKINIAVLICATFIFRLLFVTIGCASSLNANQTNNPVKHHFSSVVKKSKKDFDPITSSKNYGYSNVEIFEEDSDDEEKFKLTPSPLLFPSYSKIENKLKDKLRKITPFNKYFSRNSSHRYVEYRVFRI